MSTRCTVSVFESAAEAAVTPPSLAPNGAVYHLYRHHDGYPSTEHGVLATLRKALPYAWPLPRFEADEFAAAIVAAWKARGVEGDEYRRGGGDIRLIPNGTTPDAFASDSEFHYNVWCDAKGNLMCQPWQATYPVEVDDGRRAWVVDGRPVMVAGPKTPRFGGA